MEIFKERGRCAPDLFVSHLLKLAYEKGLIKKRALKDERLPRFSARKWRRIFKVLCPRARELVWVEQIDLRDLLRFLSHPKSSQSPASLTVKVSPIRRT